MIGTAVGGEVRAWGRMLGLWGPVLLWAGVIYYWSSVPYLRITDTWWDWVLRKMAHMVEFGVLARLLARALSGSTPWGWKKIFVGSLAGAALYAVSDEVHQIFVPGRHFGVLDIGIDILGAWVALGIRP